MPHYDRDATETGIDIGKDINIFASIGIYIIDSYGIFGFHRSSRWQLRAVVAKRRSTQISPLPQGMNSIMGLDFVEVPIVIDVVIGDKNVYIMQSLTVLLW